MNRRQLDELRDVRRGPRERGDEPADKARMDMLREWSPRTRG